MRTRPYKLKLDTVAPDPLLAQAPETRKIYSVTELAEQVQALFEERFALPVWVEGELSEPKIYPSGHLWFDLKDGQSNLKSVMWRDSVRSLKFKPEQGLKVLCYGRVEFYAPRGEIKFSVKLIEPKGMGALQLAFEQLKEKLQKEGLFSLERKRPLPVFPERIGIVTSPKGAAIDDLLKVLNGEVEALLFPTRVQGNDAAEAIARGLKQLSAREDLDLIICGRGGGSLEDLWSFNEEEVAWAVAECRHPVISAVGHEKDVTICDLVADLRAPTPTKAAEMVLARRRECLSRLSMVLEESAFVEPEEWLKSLMEQVEELEEASGKALEQALLSSAHELKNWHVQLLGCSPQAVILHQAERLRRLQGTLGTAAAHWLEQWTSQVHAFAGKLHALSPLAVLERGYSITFDSQEKPLKQSRQAKIGESIRTRLSKGQIISRVESIQD